MPEGDTVFKLARYLGEALQGQRLSAGRLAARPDVDLSGIALAGRRVGAVFARGKHLFIDFDGRDLLRSHLGMHGSWHGYAHGEPWRRPVHQASIVLETSTRVFVCFNAAQVEWQRADGLRRRRFERQLGPDLMTPAVSLDAVRRRARAQPGATPLVDILLDQHIACGIGNVYKSEVLFLERRSPRLCLDDVDDAGLSALFRCASGLLRANSGGGVRVTRRASDEAGKLWVYGRTGRPCLRCDTPIRSARLGRHQRSTFWCPACQRETPASDPA